MGAISLTVQFALWTYKWYNITWNRSRHINIVNIRHNLDWRYLHQNNKARPTYQRHPVFVQTEWKRKEKLGWIPLKKTETIRKTLKAATGLRYIPRGFVLSVKLSSVDVHVTSTVLTELGIHGPTSVFKLCRGCRCVTSVWCCYITVLGL